ncbi:uncharacterized protein LOC116841543 [Odontomachus brunneus]|uniref:uncharacterized protein LOC116841543 n=1 Tax=Odontomachus brunneus TaxID=486640 RepID=UPI0013F19D43|nr:uncharacterized protein LOC116841543 [Odontomachus brunneus]
MRCLVDDAPKVRACLSRLEKRALDSKGMLRRRIWLGPGRVGAKRRGKRPADSKRLLRRRIRLRPSAVCSKKRKQNVAALISGSVARLVTRIRKDRQEWRGGREFPTRKRVQQ